MKNTFFKLNLLQLKSLSKLGLNVKQVYSSKSKQNKTFDLVDIIEEIEKQKENKWFYSPIGQKEKWFLLQKPQFHNTTIILSVSPA